MNTPPSRLMAASSAIVLFGFSTSAANAQTNRIDLQIDDPRPVAAAVQALTKQYPFVITYEDPRYEYQADIKDVTEEVRNPLAAPNPGARVLVPLGGSLTVSYDVSAETKEPADVAETVQRIVDAQAVSGTGGQFVIERSGKALHVVPHSIRNSRGQWVEQDSILNAIITIPSQEMNGYEMLAAICAAVSKATGTTVNVGTVSLNLFNRYQGQIEASNERARDVLMRMLGSVNERLTWRLLYDPSGKFGYALNINAVAARPEADIPIEPLPRPRPGDPLPAGPRAR